MDALPQPPHPQLPQSQSPLPAADDGPGWRPERCDRVALMLQGGGALGAYQGGVYQGLEEAGIRPDWIAGVSIGAINAALIAGNPPGLRLERLRAFWEAVTNPLTIPSAAWLPWPDPWAGAADAAGALLGDAWRRARHQQGAAAAMLRGAPGFFTPTFPPPWAAPRGSAAATAYYDTAPLRRTLDALVDWGRVNRGGVRFAVGAVGVTSGNFTWFDNATTEIGPEHVMASGALPPALPMVRVGTDPYWDGGLVSNTPLSHLLDDPDHGNALVFQVDLFPARGRVPRDLDDVLGREKDIRYSSRTRAVTDAHARLHDLKARLHRALSKVPEAALTADERRDRDALADLPEVLIHQLVYRQRAHEGQARDYVFTAEAMRGHWGCGLEDTRATLRRRDRLEMPPPGAGIVAHDIHADRAGR